MTGMKIIALGVGDAFSALHYSTSFAIWADDTWLLVDCAHPIRKVLHEAGIAAGIPLDIHLIDSVVLTHLHADHASGIEGFTFYSIFVLKKKTRLITHPEVSEKLWSGLLGGGMAANRDPITKVPKDHGFGDYFELTSLSETAPTRQGPFSIECRMTLHPVPTTAVRVSGGGKMFAYSSDTRFDHSLIDWLSAADLIFHEANFPPTHTSYDDLKDLPADIREKMRIIHCPDRYQCGGEIAMAREGELFEL